MTIRLSIVLPTLDEATGIAATLDALAPWRAAGHEVIVADGGSRDATVAIASPRADRAVVAPRGRASQMNVGAAVASGDVLLFLHADSRLPADAAAAIDEAIRAGRRWGRFDVAIDGRSRMLPVVAAAMNLRSRLTGIATGDQGIFIERSTFAETGGFPSIPLMEDLAISRALKRRAGRPACLSSRIRTSGRRWDRDGAWRTILLMWRLRTAWALGADPAKLAKAYGVPVARRRVLQVFARAPVVGEVKTRLARALGNEAAAAAYRAMVEHTLATADQARRRGLIAAVELWCSPDVSHPALAEWARRHGASLHPQQGDDLGARMRHALASALARGDVPMLIGSDCPAIDADYLGSASAALDTHDAVFGPVEDGGYALVGLARDVDAFTGIAWSTPSVMAETRAVLRRAGTRWMELSTLWDVDSAEDLTRWRAPGARAA